MTPAPGPYKAINAGRPGGVRRNVQAIKIIDANGRTIACVYGKEGERMATALLLADAPEMRDMLRAYNRVAHT